MFDIAQYIFIITLFLISIAVHELGHLLYFRTLNKDIDIRFYYNSWRRFGFKAGKIEDYQDLTDFQYFSVNFWGITAGTLFILVISVAYNPFMLLLLFPYLLGCKEDIRIIFKYLKGEQL